MEGIATFEDWRKLDLVVGRIENVTDINGADKLWKLDVDIGTEIRTLCAGIKKFYSKGELIGRKIIVIKNLAPKIMRGIESKGMLLAAVNKDESKIVFIAPEKDIEVGTAIR